VSKCCIIYVKYVWETWKLAQSCSVSVVDLQSNVEHRILNQLEVRNSRNVLISGTEWNTTEQNHSGNYMFWIKPGTDVMDRISYYQRRYVPLRVLFKRSEVSTVRALVLRRRWSTSTGNTYIAIVQWVIYFFSLFHCIIPLIQFIRCRY